MIKIKTFPIEFTEEANAFMEQNPPRSTEKQSGVVFHNGYIVIIYDDGTENPIDKIGMIKTQLEGDRTKKSTIEQSKLVAEIALKDLENEMKAVRPKWYDETLSHTELKRHISEESGVPTKDVNEGMIEALKEKVSGVANKTEATKNEILMDNHELKRINYSIAAWESMLKKK